jgi:hypothetical protein
MLISSLPYFSYQFISYFKRIMMSLLVFVPVSPQMKFKDVYPDHNNSFIL